MRRAQEDDRAQLVAPSMLHLFRVVTRAPREQPTHAVGDDRDRLDGDRPLRDELLEQRVERPSVRGDVQAAVVVEMHRRVSEIARRLPRLVVH